MSFTEERFQQCRVEDCRRAAVVSGHCRVCYTRLSNRKHQRTSDGLHSGRVPKLSENDVAEAKRMYACLKTRGEIARHFGVSLSTIRKALAST